MFSKQFPEIPANHKLRNPLKFPSIFRTFSNGPPLHPTFPDVYEYLYNRRVGSPRDFTPARVGDGVRVGIAEIIAKLRQNVGKEILYEPKPKRWATCGFPGRQIWVFFFVFCLPPDSPLVFVKLYVSFDRLYFVLNGIFCLFHDLLLFGSTAVGWCLLECSSLKPNRRHNFREETYLTETDLQSV